MTYEAKPSISIYQFFDAIPDEQTAIEFFERRRWNGTPTCGHCGSLNVRETKNHKPMKYRCRSCRKHFSVRTGTVLAEAHIPLRKWLLAIYLIHTSRKGVSSVQMAKTIDVTQKSAWFLMHRIRKAMEDEGSIFSGEVEVDEAYFGGRERNKHASDKAYAGRGTAGKQPVVGMRERETGRVKAEVVASTDKQTLQGFVCVNTETDTTVYTDEHGSYKGMPRKHESVKHSVGEFVRDQAHTNGVESFWATLRRGYIGTHHYMSPQHLHRYISEFAYRHGVGIDNTLATIEKTIDGMLGKRLTYEDLTR